MFQIEYNITQRVWYAMKASYGRSLKAKELLDSMGVECFVPMCSKEIIEKGRKRSLQVPAIPNLLFINANLEQLKSVKSNIDFIHNMLCKSERGENCLDPIVVSERQMNQFITVVNSQERVSYVDLATTPLEKGSRVRIIEGAFKGYEAILVKMQGVRKRRVILDIIGLVGISIADVDATMVEKINVK